MYVLLMHLSEWVGQLLLNKLMKSLIFAAILFLFPFYAKAGFPEGENGYDLKKIEEFFKPQFFNHP